MRRTRQPTQAGGKEKGLRFSPKPFDFVARPERFERPTPWFVAKYSIQLSYGRAVKLFYYKFGCGDRI